MTIYTIYLNTKERQLSPPTPTKRVYFLHLRGYNPSKYPDAALSNNIINGVWVLLGGKATSEVQEAEPLSWGQWTKLRPFFFIHSQGR